MAYEVAVSSGVLTDEQLFLANKYCLQKYVKSLTITHRNTNEEISHLEKATRGQADNDLWKLLRINRTTASGSQSFCGEATPAMEYGVCNEKLLKQNSALMSIIVDGIEKRLNKRVVESVLDCGLFLSPIGLYSASPDAYFRLESGELVVLEIKCPYVYRNKTLEQIRLEKNNTRAVYRVQNTALSLNRTGPLHVTVSKRNDHYRQIQTQMYVTGAVLAVYMVKFSDMPEIHFVERDEGIIGELEKRELEKLSMYVKENTRSRIMTMERERFRSFARAHNITTSDAKRFAQDGLYWWCGVVMCYFCEQQFEIIDKNVTQVLQEHNPHCNKEGNISVGLNVNAAHPRFLNIVDRINSFVGTPQYSVQHKQLAADGLFYDGTKLVMYCCGGIGGEHQAGCTTNV
ncbi:alkaline exonuclease [Erinnyis ello granulovirus]|uniref:Alkaline exonuclease n=1 Tax=Erinnyis ello granulovirus TaxID=307444 RepID=A0A097DAT4_9BBAC|nr:alkaline exonuclease [Erinnyis ello granulovirus]AIS92117.1 alkaline exonuclease [Erinnyis ello granulovirus]ARX71458.1 alkaline exonuclease [Erinnyis ello granulovirus]ARX71588.1 alkaline exonuclease [Erinnyis ello granulovirus]ARX71718.1 alkaline exonuclease [Erinnyis ello granulovirus]ARX71848.1 alkaline exonuclease [Erinnyis ello granulovirus]